MSSNQLLEQPSGYIQDFWEAPGSAFFNQKVVAQVRNVSEKTLEADRWRGIGIPFRKVGGRILYRKSDVVAYLEGHELVTSTSQYGEKQV